MPGYHRSNEKCAALNPERNYAQGMYARALARLMDHNLMTLDYKLWSFCVWLLPDLRERFKKLAPEVEKELTPALKRTWRKDTAWCQRQKFARLPNDVDSLLEDYEPAGEAVYEMLHQALREKGARLNPPANFRRAAASLRDLFGFNETALALCTLLYLKNGYDQIIHFTQQLDLFKTGSLPLLAKALARPISQFYEAIDALKDLDILRCYDQNLDMTSDIQRLWHLPKGKNPQDLFCRPLAGETLALENFPISQADLAYLKELLTLKSSSPVHVLLYGPPGTGKTSFARSLAEHLRVKAWNVMNRDGERRAALMAAVNIASRHPGALVVVDEAERVLNDTGLSQSWPSRNGSANQMAAFMPVCQDKSWINSFLDEPGRRVIWIVNEVESLHPAIRRRFGFSLYFENPGRRERRQLWRHILAKHQAEELLSGENLEHLVKEYSLPAAVIDQAVRQGQAMTGPESPALGENILKAVKAYERLMNDGHNRKPKPRPATRYTTAGVSLEGSPEELLKKLKRLDDLKRSGAELPPGFGTLLFYGPPGTGKTALARHLAEQLEKELLVKRASDIFGPYVGETEQNIAAAFREAEREDAVLVVDEADSFIFSREIAQRSWESGFVNEFLTALEECRFFFIATCNRREALDAAAMRRFAFKVAFTYAGPEQAAALYAQLLAPLTDEPFTAETAARLAALNRLTPGDFQAVRSRNQVFFEEKPSHDHLLRELAREEELKLEKESRRIGFHL